MNPRLVIAGAVIAAVGMVIFFQVSTTVDNCQSVLGQVLQPFAPGAQQQCQQANFLRTIGVFGAAGGVVLAAVGLVTRQNQT